MKNTDNRSFWQRWAFLYTPFMRRNEQAYQQMCRLLEKQVDPSASVLELACGTGQLSFLMAGKARFWLATDFSENMIREAEKQNMPPAENLQFQVADATNLSYENESFDLVVIANALHIMPHPEKALSEIRRVLKKGGTLFAPTFVYPGHKTTLFMRCMEKIGFKTYYKWTMEEYLSFARQHGFPDASSCLIPARPMPECILTARK